MIFDVYYPFRNKEGKFVPGTKPVPTEWSKIVNEISRKPDVSFVIDQIRKVQDKDLQAELKKGLPAITFMGKSSGTRKNEDMTPTQLVMLDIDHCEDAKAAWQQIWESMTQEWMLENVVVAHLTPRKGLRIIMIAQEGLTTVEENLEWARINMQLDKYGDFDTATKDFARLSFMFKRDDLLFESASLYTEFTPFLSLDRLRNDAKTEAEQPKQADLFTSGEQSGKFTAEEEAEFNGFCYRGTPLRKIIDKYLEVFGEPGAGEKHGYYNDMVKNFRCICDNNKRLLLYMLPAFGHSYEERESQIQSICRVNTLSTLPKRFYFFLKDNGFYKNEANFSGSIKEYMLSEEEQSKSARPPYAPPVFREILRITPDDFVMPAMNALLPIMGTLTSYLRATYPYDGREHSSSFFSVIYAPPGTGKGFVERFMDLFFEDLRLRDFVQSERENVYLRVIQKKGDNDRSPDMPHVSLRLIPPKNSEAEFLQKQKDNHGYHMFTYAAEMDSWAKGVKAAGGNKDDMIRIAWDNGEYGQQFKSANTFKGTVKLFWNVLITGTIAQVENYFKNVENGLVTRCSFTSIDNQEFAMPPVWKKLSRKELNVIKKFTKRCDANTYATPCSVDLESLAMVSDENFDKEVDWKFQFKEQQYVDMDWLMPIINRFEEEQMKKGAKDIDRARDVFRRRVGVRGFRLGIICMALWDKPKASDLEKCKAFIYWWMNQDIESMMRLWGDKYNEQTETCTTKVQRTVFDSLEQSFTRTDVFNVCVKQGIRTPVRRIIHEWVKLGYCDKLDKDNFKKRVKK